MQNTDTEYKRIVQGDYSTNYKIVLNNVEYAQNHIWSGRIRRNIFQDNPVIGKAIVGEIDVTIDFPNEEVPIRAKIEPYVQVEDMAGNTSGWLRKGIYYIDTREKEEGIDKLHLHGYDDMIKADTMYDGSSLAWPATKRQVLNEIASFMGVQLDARTQTAFPNDSDYCVKMPTNYTYREVLGFIGSMKCGNFCMSDNGELLFIGLNDLPDETFYLISESGSYITFGGTKILIRAVS